MITIPVPPGPPKRRIVEMAYGKCGVAGYEFGLTPEEVNDALSEMNAMMLEWPFSGLGFVQPAYGVGDADEQSGIPADTLAAVATQLALRIAPILGKTLPEEARGGVAKSLSYLHSKVASIPTMPFANHTPRGAGGERHLNNPFINDSFVVTTTGNTTSGSNQIIVADPTGIRIGFSVSGSGIPAGSTVTFVSASTITISDNATATATGVILTFQGA